jgi:hypothetical protein
MIVGSSAGCPGSLTVMSGGAVPGVPTNVTSIAKDAAATVSWLPAGGAGITSYTVTPYIGGSAQTTTTVVAPATSAAVSGLTNATSYTFTVKASNASGAGPESAASGANTPRVGQVFGDEFNGTVIDPAWAVLTRDGDQSNSELQFYLPAQVALDGNSNLVITVNSSSYTGATYSDASYPANNGNVTRSYRSGMMQWDTFNVIYGSGKTVTVQFSAKMPAGVGSGLWPGSGWMLGANCEATNHLNPDNVGSCSWPNSGSDEIDIAEFGVLGGGSLVAYNAQVHSTGISDGGTQVSCSDAHVNAHLYEINWSSGNVVWKLDGTTVKTLTAAPSQALFLMFNVAVHATVSATFPDQMTVDYVRVFNQ